MRKGRGLEALRPIEIIPDYIKYPAGSVYIAFGETKVVCNATLEEKVPPFLSHSGSGWITAEYGMLPCSTHVRTQREAEKGRIAGRTMEIKRLIGRSIRAAIDLTKIPDRTIRIDCDVIQADGGTRIASVCGAFLAVHIAFLKKYKDWALTAPPIKNYVGAVSVGFYKGELLLDLDYEEDSKSEVDMNVVMNDAGEFIEIQGTAEGKSFSREQMNMMLELSQKGIIEIIDLEKEIIGNYKA